MFKRKECIAKLYRDPANCPKGWYVFRKFGHKPIYLKPGD